MIIIILQFIYNNNNVFKCIDIDECNIDNGDCQHNCHNNYGSYSCSCYDGYYLLEDSHSCYGKSNYIALCLIDFTLALVVSCN